MSNDTPARLGAQASTPRSLLVRLLLPLALLTGLVSASIGLGAASPIGAAVQAATGAAHVFDAPLASLHKPECGALPLPC